jgi:aminoglycoside phosphotransferase family enzyme
MDNAERNEVPDLPESIGVALDRELLAPETLLVMCGLTAEEIADEIAEFSTEKDSKDEISQQEEVLEMTAFRVGEVLDTIRTQISETALVDLGKMFLVNVASLTLTQLVVEQRAIVRHQNQELDHNCQTEQCPFGWVQVEPKNDLMTNAGSSLASRLDTSAMWESEW